MQKEMIDNIRGLKWQCEECLEQLKSKKRSKTKSVAKGKKRCQKCNKNTVSIPCDDCFMESCETCANVGKGNLQKIKTVRSKVVGVLWKCCKCDGKSSQVEGEMKSRTDSEDKDAVTDSEVEENSVNSEGGNTVRNDMETESPKKLDEMKKKREEKAKEIEEERNKIKEEVKTEIKTKQNELMEAWYDYSLKLNDGRKESRDFVFKNSH